MDAELVVKTTNKGHEMLKSAAMARPDKGRSRQNVLELNQQTPTSVKGRLMGKEVTGICHMELVGGW